MGRPSKYEKEIRDKLPAVQGWARNGLSNEQIAHNLGINVATLYEYQKKYDDFSEALKKGKEVADFEVENALFKRATGFEYVETKTETEGGIVTKVTTTTKFVPPDVGAAAFWLKNRKPTEWRDRKEIGADLSGDGSITFNIIPASQRPPEDEEEREE